MPDEGLTNCVGDDVTRTVTCLDSTGQPVTRPYNDEENENLDQRIDTARKSNEGTLEDQARDSIAGNKAFLAIASPTNAQVVAQVRALTRQVNGLIRLQARLLDEVE